MGGTSGAESPSLRQSFDVLVGYEARLRHHNRTTARKDEKGSGAGGETRTPTGRSPLRPERSASANSTTPAVFKNQSLSVIGCCAIGGWCQIGAIFPLEVLI